jgi:hypothetical protein
VKFDTITHRAEKLGEIAAGEIRRIFMPWFVDIHYLSTYFQ